MENLVGKYFGSLGGEKYFLFSDLIKGKTDMPNAIRIDTRLKETSFGAFYDDTDLSNFKITTRVTEKQTRNAIYNIFNYTDEAWNTLKGTL